MQSSNANVVNVSYSMTAWTVCDLPRLCRGIFTGGCVVDSSEGTNWADSGLSIHACGVLDRIRGAIKEDLVVGIHLYFGGGRSGDNIVFSSYEQCLEYTTRARAGDLFILWSIAELRKRGKLLIDNPTMRHSTLVPPRTLKASVAGIKRYLARDVLNEVFIVKMSTSGALEAIQRELVGFTEDIQRAKTVEMFAAELQYVFALKEVDSPGCYLAKAKRPDKYGKVPMAGAY